VSNSESRQHADLHERQQYQQQDRQQQREFDGRGTSVPSLARMRSNPVSLHCPRPDR
jgi:hypothetical protein